MSIVVLCLNHKTAPLEIRERLAFNAPEVAREIASEPQNRGEAASG